MENEISDIEETLGSYAYCNVSVNTTDKAAVNALNKVEELSMDMAVCGTLFNTYVAEHKAQVDAYCKENPEYRFVFDEIAEEAKHQMPKELEELAADLMRSGSDAFGRLQETISSSACATGQDCKCHCGLHVFEDQYITEIVDPATGAPVPDGEYGEVVFTSLTREAMPIIRYRTHDISRILSREKCECGRTSLRIDRITGRTDDMLIVKGVNFYPRQVEQALKEIPGIADEFQIILEERHGMTDVTINVEAEPGVTGHTVAKHLRERLGFLPKGDVFPIGALPRNEGKAKRVIKKVLD